MTDFQRDLKRGKHGEELVKRYLEQEGYEVRDTSTDSSYFSKDIDLLLADGLAHEVKTDYVYSRTGNLAVELYSIYGDGSRREGWLYTSEADYFDFVNPHNDRCFVSIQADVLRSLVELEGLQVRCCNDGYKKVYCALFPPKKYFEDGIFELCYIDD